MAITYIIDPLAIATQGLQNSNDDVVYPITVATQGFIFTVDETIVPPDVEDITGGGGSSGDFIYPQDYQEPKKPKKKKRIRVSCTVDGRTYTKEVIVADVKLSVKNVEVGDDISNFKVILSNTRVEDKR